MRQDKRAVRLGAAVGIAGFWLGPTLDHPVPPLLGWMTFNIAILSIMEHRKSKILFASGGLVFGFSFAACYRLEVGRGALASLLALGIVGVLVMLAAILLDEISGGGGPPRRRKPKAAPLKLRWRPNPIPSPVAGPGRME